jgi:hypothetical protein
MVERQSRSAQVLRDGALNRPGARTNVTACSRFTTVPTSAEVQGLGPWRGLGQRPNLPLPQRQMGWAPDYHSTTAPIPRSGFVLGSKAVVRRETLSAVRSSVDASGDLPGNIAVAIAGRPASIPSVGTQKLNGRFHGRLNDCLGCAAGADLLARHWR